MFLLRFPTPAATQCHFTRHTITRGEECLQPRGCLILFFRSGALHRHGFQLCHVTEANSCNFFSGSGSLPAVGTSLIICEPIAIQDSRHPLLLGRQVFVGTPDSSSPCPTDSRQLKPQTPSDPSCLHFDPTAQAPCQAQNTSILYGFNEQNNEHPEETIGIL